MAAVIQIPNLPAVIALNGAELFEAVQAGVSVKVSTVQLAAYIQATPLAALTFTSPLVRTADNVALTTVPVTLGGTALATLTLNGLVYGNGAAAAGVTAAGTTGQVLVGNTGAAPSWAALSGVGVTSFSGGTTGLTPSAVTTGVITLAGTLIAANGGTGFASYAVGDIVYADTTTTLAKLADIATGNALITGGIGAAPIYGKIGLTTHISGTLAIGNGGTGVVCFGEVTSKTASYPVVAADSYRDFDNNGAVGSVTFSLPASVVGLAYGFAVMEAQDVVIDAPGGVTIYLGEISTTAGGTITSNAVGSYLFIKCRSATEWIAQSSMGSWTPA